MWAACLRADKVMWFWPPALKGMIFVWQKRLSACSWGPGGDHSASLGLWYVSRSSEPQIRRLGFESHLPPVGPWRCCLTSEKQQNRTVSCWIQGVTSCEKYHVHGLDSHSSPSGGSPCCPVSTNARNSHWSPSAEHLAHSSLVCNSMR